MILLISASWAARIIGVNLQHLTLLNSFIILGFIFRYKKYFELIIVWYEVRVYVFFFFFFFFFFGSTGVWTQGLSLGRQALYRVYVLCFVSFV
jgi:hypothetical protein